MTDPLAGTHQPKLKHCDHECVCNKYINYTNTGATKGRVCNGETWCFKLCPNDTRTFGSFPAEHPTPEPFEWQFQPVCVDKPCMHLFDKCPVKSECDTLKECEANWRFLQDNPNVALENERVRKEHDACIAAQAMERLADAITREHPDTMQATEGEGDLYAWNAETVDRVLKSLCPTHQRSKI